MKKIIIKNPYASDAQRRKFHAMLQRGEIDAKTVKEFDKASKGKKLPAYKNPVKWLVFDKRNPTKNFARVDTEEKASRLMERLNRSAGRDQYDIISIEHYGDSD
jgi:hypothetical protein